MTSHRGTETAFELTTLDRLIAQDYQWVHGKEVPRQDEREVVVADWLAANLKKRYPALTDGALQAVVKKFSLPEGVDTLHRNMAFHNLLTKGFEAPVERPDGTTFHVHVHPVDWTDVTANDFKVVNQLSIQGNNDRRPDVLVYVNGLPLVVFELKNPWAPEPTIEQALNQIQHYILDIPQLFEFNAFVVVSDGIRTQHGMWTADAEWYAPWKSINGFKVYQDDEFKGDVLDESPSTLSTMKVLIEGLFPKKRLLSYLRDFIAFEVANDVVTKKGAKYHQFFAVKLAAQKARETVTAGKDQRIGVIWHTTGSGKSLSMAFLVGILRRMPEMENPSFIIQVDRTDLDGQLHEQFVAVKHLVGEVQHADDTDELRDLLRTEGGEVVFSTIEKFRLKEGESQHEVLSSRRNIIVIADEAHRSQYGLLDGFARRLGEALPNACRIGFTGTPVNFAGANTTQLFGEVIHTYDIRQAQEDGATVRIYYAPRQAKLRLGAQDVDAALAEIAANESLPDIERRKTRWAALAAAAGAKDRVEALAKDLLDHYLDRTKTFAGKAMVVTMSRPNCVALYDALTALPGCPEVKVVMTSKIAEDPKAWNEAGHVTTATQRKKIKARMKDPKDPLSIVIVTDMWLTGTDIPCLHTLYVDKPMRGHTMIQAISRVNRVFKDKPHGLIVDYIGIADDLREATSKYTEGGGKGDPAPGIEEQGRPLFFECLKGIREMLPEGKDYGAWRHMTHIEVEDLYAEVYGVLTGDDAKRDAFLQAELRLTNAFLLVKGLDDCRIHADEVIFCQRVRKQLGKATSGGTKKQQDIEKAVRDLVDDAIESEGVVDIFESAGLPKADLSILDDKFLATFKNMKHEDLALKLLHRLLEDAIRAKASRNLTKAKSFQQLLEQTLKRYHARLIDSAAVIQLMIQIKQESDADAERATTLGLHEDEVPFYDAVAARAEELYETPFLRDLVHQVVDSIKRNLKVDWTEPHRDSVKAEIRAAVRRVLRKNKVRAEDLEPFTEAIMTQAAAMFGDWMPAA